MMESKHGNYYFGFRLNKSYMGVVYRGSTGVEYGVHGLEFPKIRGTCFGGPCNKSYSILASKLV